MYTNIKQSKIESQRNVAYIKKNKQNAIDINITQMMAGKHFEAMGEEMRHVQMSR